MSSLFLGGGTDADVFTVCRLLQVMLKVFSLSLVLTVGHTVFQRFFFLQNKNTSFLAHPTYVLSTSWSIFTYLGKNVLSKLHYVLARELHWSAGADGGFSALLSGTLTVVFK